jgi:hypothetical protein
MVNKADTEGMAVMEHPLHPEDMEGTEVPTLVEEVVMVGMGNPVIGAEGAATRSTGD